MVCCKGQEDVNDAKACAKARVCSQSCVFMFAKFIHVNRTLCDSPYDFKE